MIGEIGSDPVRVENLIDDWSDEALTRDVLRALELVQNGSISSILLSKVHDDLSAALSTVLSEEDRNNLILKFENAHLTVGWKDKDLFCCRKHLYAVQTLIQSVVHPWGWSHATSMACFMYDDDCGEEVAVLKYSQKECPDISDVAIDARGGGDEHRPPPE